MRVGRHERLTLVVLGRVVHGRELLGGLRGVGDAQRRPVALVAPHGLLLLDEPQAVPDLGEHADAPRHVVGATGHPGRRGVIARLDPQVLVELVGGVLGLDVVGAVLEAEQVARRLLVHGGRRRPPVADLAPPQGGGPEGDAGEVADRVDADLGVVGAGLDQQVAVGLGGVELVAGEGGHALLENRRHLGGQAEAVLAIGVDEQALAHAEGDGQTVGLVTPGFAGVLGRQLLVGAGLAPDELAGGHLLGGHGPVGQEGFQLLDVGGGDVEGRGEHVVLGGGGDPRLVVAAEGVGREDGLLGSLGGLPGTPTGDTGQARERSPQARAGEHGAAAGSLGAGLPSPSRFAGLIRPPRLFSLFGRAGVLRLFRRARGRRSVTRVFRRRGLRLLLRLRRLRDGRVIRDRGGLRLIDRLATHC